MILHQASKQARRGRSYEKLWRGRRWWQHRVTRYLNFNDTLLALRGSRFICAARGALERTVPLGKSNLRKAARSLRGGVCNYCHRGRWRWNVVLKGNLSWRSLLPPPSYFLWSDLDVMRDDDGCYFITCGRPYNLLFSSIWNTIARGPARRLTIACHVGGGALKLEILRTTSSSGLSFSCESVAAAAAARPETREPHGRRFFN